MESAAENKHNLKASALDSFLYALKSEESKRQYPQRLRLFFNFLKIEGETVEEQATAFLEMVKTKGNQWVKDCVVQYIGYQRQQIAKKALTAGTLGTYIYAVELFTETNDIPINWKGIRRGLPRTRVAANDRAPDIKELRKLADYHQDRYRIRVIVYTYVFLRDSVRSLDEYES